MSYRFANVVLRSDGDPDAQRNYVVVGESQDFPGAVCFKAPL